MPNDSHALLILLHLHIFTVLFVSDSEEATEHQVNAAVRQRWRLLLDSSR